MDAFAFLTHLRRLPEAGAVPVLLTVPRKLEDPQLAVLREAAEAAAEERQWPRGLRPAASEPLSEPAGPSPLGMDAPGPEVG